MSTWDEAPLPRQPAETLFNRATNVVDSVLRHPHNQQSIVTTDMETNLNPLNGLSIAVIIAPALSFGAPAYAADLLDAPEIVEPAPPVAPNLWHGSLTVYGWGAAWINGDVGVGGLGPVDVGDGGGSVDLFEILDGFFMANGDVRYG